MMPKDTFIGRAKFQFIKYNRKNGKQIYKNLTIVFAKNVSGG
jgi:hypothetical protein